jgi:Na+-transporting NADH:ubiquinone oxidoreductase subunit B
MITRSLPGARSVAEITLAQSAALILPLGVVTMADTGRLAHLGVALGAAFFFELVFAVLRKHSLSSHGVTTALIVTVLAPPETAIWQMIVVVSLGVVLGELVFGGRGFGFLNAGTVALALLVISFPQAQLPASTQTLALATLPGAILLLALGLISGRVLLGVALGSLATMIASGQSVDAVALANALAFGLVFLICDPIAAAATSLGRWIYGVLAGGLVVVFSPEAGIAAQAIVFAALLAGLFAPLIDHLVVLDYVRRRRGRVHA